MSDELVFTMGRFESRYPIDRQYAENHMWGQRRGDVLRFGFSAYAVRLMRDIYFLDWIVAPGAVLRERQVIGAIESKKAESDLYSPIAGSLRQLNESLLEDPSLINSDTYGEGWLFEIEGKGDSLHSPDQYIRRLEDVWEITQLALKGQVNQCAGRRPRVDP